MTTTFIAGLTVDGLVAPMLLDSSMDGEVFLAYVEQILCPELKRLAFLRSMDIESSHRNAMNLG